MLEHKSATATVAMHMGIVEPLKEKITEINSEKM